MSNPFKILFLCTGNSSRSILAEHLISHIAPGRFVAYSAGAQPSGTVNPVVIQVLREDFRIDASKARSKSLDEYKAIHFDFVITVCDDARETCPVWPGQPIVAHWHSLDPAKFKGSPDEIYRQTLEVALQIKRRIDLFTSLPLEKMERLKLSAAMDTIGKYPEGVPVES